MRVGDLLGAQATACSARWTAGDGYDSTGTSLVLLRPFVARETFANSMWLSGGIKMQHVSRSAVDYICLSCVGKPQAPLERTRLGTPILTESVLLDLLPISGPGADALRGIQVM